MNMQSRLTNATDFDLHGNSVRVWPYRALSCIALGGLAFTFALMAMLSAIMASSQRSRLRSRPRLATRTTVLSWRDSIALILLCGQPANFALGVIAVWFGTKNIQSFLTTDTCTKLVVVSVASQWNISLSTPIVALYYALVFADLDPDSRTANQNSREGLGAEPDRQNTDPRRQPNAVEEREVTNETNGGGQQGTGHGRRCLNRLGCRSWWTGNLGVLTLVVVVYSLTLAATHFSLSDVLSEAGVSSSAAREGPREALCSRFFALPELFPRRAVGILFLVSVAVTAAATFALSRELERKGKRRHVVDTVTSGDVSHQLLSFTRPPDEGVHFHHYAGPPRRPGPQGPGDGRYGGEYNQTDGRPEVLVLATGETNRLLATGSDSALDDDASLASTTTEGPWSGSEFYDAERTRHIAQSPPPVSRIRRTAPNCTQLRRDTVDHVTTLRSSPQRSLVLSADIRTNHNQQNLQRSNSEACHRRCDQLSIHSPLGSTNSDHQQPTNQNTRPGELVTSRRPLPLLSSSSSHASEAGIDTDQGTQSELDVDSFWERIQHMRLVSLIFPHRQNGSNRKRFSHTKVEHVREDILPSSMAASSSARNRFTTDPFVSHLDLPHLMTCHIVCVTGILFILTYSVLAVFLLLTDGGRGWGRGDLHYRFIDHTFEPYVALLLSRASLDSLFCFAALVSMSPMFLTP